MPEFKVQLFQRYRKMHRLAKLKSTTSKKLIADQAKIEEAIEGLDILRYRVETEITQELNRIRDKNEDIENQHGRLFELLQSQSPMQQKGGYQYND